MPMSKSDPTKKGTFDRAFFIEILTNTYLTITFSTLVAPWAVTFTR